MHTNNTFNIVQGSGANNRNWSVIKGKRLPGGYAETGAKVIASGMTREDAIKLANKLES